MVIGEEWLLGKIEVERDGSGLEVYFRLPAELHVVGDAVVALHDGQGLL